MSAYQAGEAGGALVRAVERWRRVIIPGREPPLLPGATHTPGGSTGSPAGGALGSAFGGLVPDPPPPDPGAAGPVSALARRLDDTGCAYGRVSAAHLEQLTRAYDRLETKLNTVLMAVTGTFLSTLAGLLLYYVRGGTH